MWKRTSGSRRFGYDEFGWNRSILPLHAERSIAGVDIFNQWLASQDCSQKSLIENVSTSTVTILRTSAPSRRAKAADELEEIPLYVVTTTQVVQQRSRSFALARWFRNVLLTHRYDRKHAKPHYCFNLIRLRERCA